MNGLNRTLGLLAACALLGTTAAQAEGFKTGRDCSSSGFSTCMAVHLSVLKDGLSVGERNASWHNWAEEGRNRTFKFIPSGDDVGPGHSGHDGIIPGTCPVPSHNPLDCAAVTTVTPEPVTMTLLATGILGMSGVGLVSRRRKHPLE
jgi:hypothetical protein